MPSYLVEIHVMPRPTLLDPQGRAVEHALRALEFEGVGSVRMGKMLTLDLEASDLGAAQRDATKMCERLLANPVTEDFAVTVHEGP